MAIKRLRATTGVIALLCIMYLITYVDRVNVSAAASAIKTEFSLNNTEFGLVFSMFAYPYLILQVIGGWLGDRFGARMVLTVSAIIWALATAATGFAGGFFTLLVARFFLGLGEGATFPTATRALASWTAKSDRGFAQGLTHAFARLGNAATPLIVTVLIVWSGWRGSFFLLGAVSLLWAVGWMIYFRDDPADHPKIQASELARLPPHIKSNQSTSLGWRDWQLLAWRILPVTLVYFCYGWTLWLFLSWVPSYFEHSFALNLKNSAIFSSGVFLAGVVGDTLGGLISDYLLRRSGNLIVARRNMVIVCMLATFVSTAPILFIHDLTLSAICLSAAFFFAELTIGPMWAIPMDIAPHQSGTASGLMNTGSALAAIVSPVIAGTIIDATGNWEIIFAGSMGLMLLGTILSFAMHPERLYVPPSHDKSQAKSVPRRWYAVPRHLL